MCTDSSTDTSNTEAFENQMLFSNLDGSLLKAATQSLSLQHTFYVLVLIGILYMTDPDGCRDDFTVLPMLRPYPMKVHWVL